MVGLARLVIAGFARGGHLSALVLAACAAGLLATLFTGRARRKPPGRKRSALRRRTSHPKPPEPGILIRGTYHLGAWSPRVRVILRTSSLRFPAWPDVGLPALLVRTFGPFPAGALA
jgi:hypothetical protein